MEGSVPKLLLKTNKYAPRPAKIYVQFKQQRLASLLHGRGRQRRTAIQNRRCAVHRKETSERDEIALTIMEPAGSRKIPRDPRGVPGASPERPRSLRTPGRSPVSPRGSPPRSQGPWGSPRDSFRLLDPCCGPSSILFPASNGWHLASFLVLFVGPNKKGPKIGP